MNKTILCGVRPAALEAVSERERLLAHPHRAQAAVNHARALKMAEPKRDGPAQSKPAKKRRGK